MNISIIGLGFVGSAMYESFQQKGINVTGYDKYKNGGVGSLATCIETDLMFLCLPTQYSAETGEYDKSSIIDVLKELVTHKYTGLIVLKSTVEPETTTMLYNMFKDTHHLNLLHNPEFLTAKTALHDFHNQDHIVLGKHANCKQELVDNLEKLYMAYYPNAEISQCDSNESECMKIFVNNFYASKIQLFNEYYALCQKSGIDYDNVKDLMLKNKWINPMHTNVPGTDGKLSYGGYCFPKDTNALCNHMKRKETPSNVLSAVIKERDEMRDDNDNCV